MSFDLGDLFGGGSNVEDVLADIGKNKAQRAEDALKRASEKIAERKRTEAKANAPLPKIRGKRNPEGVWYLRAEDVLAALEQTDSQRDSPLARRIRDLLR